MLILTGTGDLIDIVTGSAGDIEVSVSWVDKDGSTITPDDDALASITTAATTTIATGPGSGARALKHLNVYNNDAAVSNLVTIRHNDGTHTAVLFECTLAPSEALVYGENGIWVRYDPSGNPYTAVGPFATQAEMEAGTATDKVVTPGRQHFHQSAAKFWGIVTVSGGTPTLQVSYNITSITDTATCRLTVTIATDISSANYVINANIEAATTTYSATTTSLCCVVRNASVAAGSFILDNLEFDIGQATDPAKWFFCGFGDLA